MMAGINRDVQWAKLTGLQSDQISPDFADAADGGVQTNCGCDNNKQGDEAPPSSLSRSHLLRATAGGRQAPGEKRLQSWIDHSEIKCQCFGVAEGSIDSGSDPDPGVSIMKC